MAAAANSRRFIERLFLRWGGSSNLHARPRELYPPIPCLLASEMVVTVGKVQVILFMFTPLAVIVFRNSSQRWMSFCSVCLICCGPNCLHCSSRALSLFRKYRACGMICPA